MDEVGIGLLRPAPRCGDDLVRKHAHRNWEGDSFGKKSRLRPDLVTPLLLLPWHTNAPSSGEYLLELSPIKKILNDQKLAVSAALRLAMRAI